MARAIGCFQVHEQWAGKDNRQSLPQANYICCQALQKLEEVTTCTDLVAGGNSLVEQGSCHLSACVYEKYRCITAVVTGFVK